MSPRVLFVTFGIVGTMSLSIIPLFVVWCFRHPSLLKAMIGIEMSRIEKCITGDLRRGVLLGKEDCSLGRRNPGLMNLNRMISTTLRIGISSMVHLAR
jgi:hypothetical protein